MAERLKLMADNIEPGRSDEALLYELILRSNLPLTSKVVPGKLGEQTFYDVAEGTLAICLERPIGQEALRGMMARRTVSDQRAQTSACTFAMPKGSCRWTQLLRIS